MSIHPILKRLILGLRSLSRLLPGLLLPWLLLPWLLLPSLLSAQATTQATRQITPTKHPFLWRIEGKGNQTLNVKSWLYGTMHLGDERLVTLPDSVEVARESVDALYCELDMDQIQKQAGKMMLKMRLPRGQTLRDQLTPELYERLSDYVTERGSNMLMFRRMRVWAVSVNLAVIEAAKQKMTQSLDVLIYKDAKSDDKEVGGLETMAEQLDALSDMSEKDHIKLLMKSLDYMEEQAAKGISPLRKMQKTYLAGDAQKLWALANEVMGEDEVSKRFMKAMLTDRNVRMADRMEKKMEDHPDKSYFFAIGAMHYPGRNGILDLLRRKGFRIKRINPPSKVNADSRPSTRKQRGRKLERVVR